MNKRYEVSLQVMNALLEATQKGLIKWNKTAPKSCDFYHAKFGDRTFLITFKYPALTGGDGSDADKVEVYFETLSLTFYAGTEGYDIVLDILAESTKEVRELKEGFLDRAYSIIQELSER